MRRVLSGLLVLAVSLSTPVFAEPPPPEPLPVIPVPTLPAPAALPSEPVPTTDRPPPSPEPPPTEPPPFVDPVEVFATPPGPLGPRWSNFEYLLWWVRPGSAPPLITTNYSAGRRPCVNRARPCCLAAGNSTATRSPECASPLAGRSMPPN